MTGEPLYSIVVPTRERHDVLESCLRTIKAQTASNFEAIVMDNFGGPETREVVESLNDERFHYHRSPDRLSMSDNWELGLGFAKGDYVLFLGDDDGLLPDCVEIATAIHAHHPGMALGWRTSLWYWPKVFPVEKQGYLLLKISSRMENRECDLWLGKVLACEEGYSALPGIYSSFVPRDLIEAVKKRHGRYFASPIPDVWSGVVDCLDTDRFLFLHRSLCLRAVSHHSTGHSQLYHGSSDKASKQFKTENSNWDQRLDSRLVEGPIFEADMLIADTILKGSKQASKRAGSFSFKAFANQLAITPLFRYFEVYDEAVAVIRELARKNGVAESELEIPSPDRLLELEGSMSGMQLRSRFGDQFVQMNTAPHLVRDVADACNFAATLLPNASQVLNGS